MKEEIILPPWLTCVKDRIVFIEPNHPHNIFRRSKGLAEVPTITFRELKPNNIMLEWIAQNNIKTEFIERRYDLDVRLVLRTDETGFTLLNLSLLS